MTEKEKGMTLAKWTHFRLIICGKNGERKKSAGIML